MNVDDAVNILSSFATVAEAAQAFVAEHGKEDKYALDLRTFETSAKKIFAACSQEGQERAREKL